MKLLKRSPGNVFASVSLSAKRAGFTTGVLVALLALVVAASAVFASARSSVEIAQLGSQGIFDEAALSAAATTRNRANQAFIIESARVIGVAEQSEVDKAIETINNGIGEFDTRVERLKDHIVSPSERRELADLAGDFKASITEFVAGLASGRELTEDDLAGIDRAYQSLASSLVADRDMVVSDLKLAQEDAGRIADAARFMVAFAIPLIAIYVFRRSVRRRQRQLLLEQELDRQREIAATKDNFIADVSHELRTPLTSIYGFATALLDPDMNKDPSSTTEFATLIASEADELSRMVDDLLTAARADEDALNFLTEEVDPAAEVELVLAPMRLLGINILSSVAQETIRADRLRLRQVLRNLVSNALKHGEPPIAVVGRLGDNGYTIVISDSGPGVPEDLESRLFERFIHEGRTPLLTGSVGLGLSIARLLVVQMGGELSYRRSDGLTSFVVELPLWEKSDDDMADPVELASTASQASQ